MAANQKFDDLRYRHPHHKKLWLYKRTNSQNWWCRFYHKSKPYRCSTQTKHKAAAESFADEWFMEKWVAVKSGIEVAKKENLPTVKDASIIAHEKYRQQIDRGIRSKETLKGILQVWRKWILPYFENMPVQDITSGVWDSFIDHVYKTKPDISHRTLYQIRNGLSVCLNAAIKRVWITIKPTLSIEFETPKTDYEGRVWFRPEEQKRLIAALDENIEFHKHTPHRRGSIELKDYVLFILYSGLRVGESQKVRFSDIDIIKKDIFTGKPCFPYIMIRNIEGKRTKDGSCKADYELVGVYKSILIRINPNSMDELLFDEHHDRMFTEMLKRHDLKYDKHGRKRDFISLRHTYICNLLIKRVPIAEVAINSRNQPKIIHEHYAKALEAEFLSSVHEKDKEKIKRTLNNYADIDIDNDEWDEEIIGEVLGKGGITREELENHPDYIKRKKLEINLQELLDKYGLTYEEMKERIESSQN